MYYKFSVKVNIGIIVAGAIINLIPLFLHDVRRHNDLGDVSNDPRDSPTMAAFYMVLIPAVDLFIDLSSQILTLLCSQENSYYGVAEVAIVTRLTDLERFLFIIGVMLQSGACFLPSHTSESTLNLFGECLTNSSLFLLLGPIITFLERCTITFNEMRCFAILITFAFGLSSNTFFYFYQNSISISPFLYYSGKSFIPFSGFLFFVTVLTCLFKYCNTQLNLPSKSILEFIRLFKNKVENYDNNDDRNESFDENNSNHRGTMSNRYDLNNTKFNNHELYTNYIPTIHMIAITIICIARFFTSYYHEKLGDFHHLNRYYVVLAAEAMVLVLEYRIRKNEIAKGLVSTFLNVQYGFQFIYFSLFFISSISLFFLSLYFFVFFFYISRYEIILRIMFVLYHANLY